MSLEVYQQNLEALQANADVVDELTRTMDDALTLGSFAFEGRAHGEWRQIAGPLDQPLLESTQTTANGLFQEVNDMQAVYSLVQGKLPPGIQWYNSMGVTFRSTSSAAGDTYFLRRFGVRGMDVSTGQSTADHYRFEWRQGGEGVPKNYLILAQLGNTAISAESWLLPDETTFVKQCLDAFANKKIVNDVLRGDFRDEQKLDEMLGALVVTLEHADLYAELRTKALATRQSNEMVTELNTAMPNRSQLLNTLGVLRTVF